jgi:hypothetical protein
MRTLNELEQAIAGMKRPEGSEVRYKAIYWLKTLHKQVERSGLEWIDPHLTLIDDPAVLFEWWKNDRKISVYVGVEEIGCLRVSGEPGNSQTEEYPSDTKEESFSSWEWLLNKSAREEVRPISDAIPVTSLVDAAQTKSDLLHLLKSVEDIFGRACGYDQSVVRYALSQLPLKCEDHRKNLLAREAETYAQYHRIMSARYGNDCFLWKDKLDRDIRAVTMVRIRQNTESQADMIERLVLASVDDIDPVIP